MMLDLGVVEPVTRCDEVASGGANSGDSVAHEMSVAMKKSPLVAR